MEHFLNFIVNKQKHILIVFLLLLIGSCALIPQVRINYNLSSYLPKDSDTNKAMDIMEKEFGLNGTAQVMVKDISKEEAYKLKERVEILDGVDTVTFSGDSINNYKDSTALFVIAIDGDDYSENADVVIDGVRQELSNYDIYMNGSAVNNRILKDAIATEIPIIAIIALVFIIVVLLVTATSWLEPLLFLLIAGLSIILNMGTNSIFGEISFITAAIAALLQLALSMDYSIMLLHRYREESENPNIQPAEAMQNALKHSFAAIGSSSFTTIAGILTMVVMSFTIGKDIGLVMGKGIFISVICVFLLMPSLILIFDKILKKTQKKALKFKGTSLSSFAYAGRKIIPFVMIVLIIGSYFVQTNLPFTYAMKFDNQEEAPIIDTFGENNQLVAIFPNTGANGIQQQQEFIKTIENFQIDNPKADISIMGYTNTAGQEINSLEAANMMHTNPMFVKVLFGLYAFDHNEVEHTKISPYHFITFLASVGEENEMLGNLFGENATLLGQLQLGLQELNHTFNQELTPEQFGEYLLQSYGTPLPSEMLLQLYQGKDTMKLIDLLSSLSKSDALPVEMKAQLEQYVDTYYVINSDIEYLDMMKNIQLIATSLSGQEIAIDIDVSLVKAAYVLYFIEEGIIPNDSLAVKDLINYSSDLIDNNSFYPSFIDDEMLEMLNTTKEQLILADKLLNGKNYSRILITTNLPAESDEIYKLVDYSREQLSVIFGDNAYIVGEVTATYDMKATFSNELLLITFITVLTLLLIVAIAFRSISIPLILVVIIQGAFWTAMSFSTMLGNPVFFLAYIIAQSLQMGATIDYGILLTSNYVEARTTQNKKDALSHAIAMSLPTILTSATVLFSATLFISLISSQSLLTSICGSISMGTLVATLFVLFGLPATLALTDKLIEKTTYKAKFYK